MWARSPDFETNRGMCGAVLCLGIRVHGTVERSLDEGPAVGGAGWSALAGDARYAVSGLAFAAADYQVDFGFASGHGPQHAGVDLVISVDGHLVQAQVQGRASEFVLGDPVTVCGELRVVADYEWDAFPLVDTRRDWLVEDVRDGDDHGEFLLLLRAVD